MNIKNFVRAGAVATLLIAGVVSAQVTSGVGVTTTPVTGTVSSGSGVNLGTVALTGSATGASITSIPITITPGGGASASNLTNCQVFNNATGASISGSVSAAGSGSTVFTLNSPLNVSSGAGVTTLNVRCDVAGGIPSTSTFTIAAGAPTLTPALNVNLDVAPSVPQGSQDVALANLSLGGMNSGASINVSSVPLSITASGGASPAHLTDCRIRATSDLSGFLTGSIAPTGGTMNFSFASPLMVLAGASPMYALTCDVSAATPVGGTFSIAVNPGSVVATNAVTGGSITPTAVVGTGPNGLPASTSGTVIVSASTGTGGTGDGTGDGTGTPGVPNTGAGGLALQIAAILILSALIAGSGAMYLRYQMR